MSADMCCSLALSATASDGASYLKNADIEPPQSLVIFVVSIPSKHTRSWVKNPLTDVSEMGTKQVGVKLVDLCVFMSKVTCRPQGWTSWETTALTDVTLFICLVFVLSLHSHSPQAVYRFYMFFLFSWRCSAFKDTDTGRTVCCWW